MPSLGWTYMKTQYQYFCAVFCFQFLLRKATLGTYTLLNPKVELILLFWNQKLLSWGNKSIAEVKSPCPQMNFILHLILVSDNLHDKMSAMDGSSGYSIFKQLMENYLQCSDFSIKNINNDIKINFANDPVKYRFYICLSPIYC